MYTQSITRRHRTAFIIAIDQSGSMNETLTFRGRRTSKAEAVAEVANALLTELLLRATREEGIRDYYDIGVIGYSGDGVRSLLSADRRLVPVTALENSILRSRRRTAERRLPDGEAALTTAECPEWIEPRAEGQTPMYEALLYVRDLADDWCRRLENRESFPPLIFNITDGEASDSDEADLLDVAAQIRAIGTDDGKTLLFNIHIATGEAPALLFLTEAETDYCNRYARMLFEMSSPMPELFDDAIRELRGASIRPPFRGMCYNASVTELISILNVGSISVNLQ